MSSMEWRRPGAVAQVHEVDDPVLADTIRIVGDGLFLSTVAGLPRFDDGGVQAVIANLRARASRLPGPWSY